MVLSHRETHSPTPRRIAEVEAQLAHLSTTKAQYDAKLEERRKQFTLLATAARDLQALMQGLLVM